MTSDRLTDALIKRAAPPASGQSILWDSEVKGFGVRITANGARAFIVNYRAGGRERRITIGSYPDWSVAAARDQAREIKARVDLGQDPMQERHVERAAPTMSDLCDRYLSDHAEAKKRESSLKDDRAMIDTIIKPDMGKIKVHDLQHSDIDKLHQKITKRAPYRANRVVALMSKMMALAVKWGFREDNPARGIEKNQEQKRTRYLSAQELKKGFQRLWQITRNRLQPMLYD